MSPTYYAIVTFGRPSISCRVACYYTSLASARRDLAALCGGTMTAARIIRCTSRREALDASIADTHEVVASR